MSRKFLVVTVLSVLSAVSCFGQENWKQHEYQPHNFKIKFFEEPVLTIDTTQYDESFLYTYNWTLSVADTLHDNSYYAVSACDYPSDYISSDSSFTSVEEFLNSTQEGIINDSDLSLLSSSLTEVNGYPGKIFKWKRNSNNIFFEFHVYLVKNTLFMLSVVSKEGKNHNIFINEFFDSFQVINLPEGTFSASGKSSSRSYTISFPGEPDVQKKVVDSPFGKLEMDIQVLEPEAGNENFVYVVVESKYPDEAFDESDPEALETFYKSSIDGSVASVSGELKSIEDIDYNGKAGKEYRAYFHDREGLLVYRIFFIDDHVYSFGVITRPSMDKNKSMNAFFDSFKIIR